MSRGYRRINYVGMHALPNIDDSELMKRAKAGVHTGGYGYNKTQPHRCVVVGSAVADHTNGTVSGYIGEERRSGNTADQCAARSEGCCFGPHGPNGTIQCEYCGMPERRKT